MLTFLPRLVRRTDSNYTWGQQVNLSNGGGQYNCEVCIWRDQWNNATERRACELKHGCDSYNMPIIEMMHEHTDEINNTYFPEGSAILLYHPSLVTRQVTVKGWTLYLNLITSNDEDAQCNASCWYHDARLADKLPVSKCAHSHKCSRAGTFWDLFVPSLRFLRLQFYSEWDYMNP